MTLLWFVLTFIAGAIFGAVFFHWSLRRYLYREITGEHAPGWRSHGDLPPRS
jgi:hypothetical protein